MNYEEVGQVLAKLAVFDNRIVGEADVLAWHTVLGRYELQDCLEAVEVHYRESSQRAMPADIRKLTLGVRDQREARERQAQRRLAIESDPTTRDRSADVAALVRQVADSLPDPTPQDKAVARARRERGRPEPPKPKAPPKKGQHKDWAPPATDEIALLVTNYLVDGHDPAAVAERFAVSVKWCRKLVRQFGPEPAQICDTHLNATTVPPCEACEAARTKWQAWRVRARAALRDGVVGRTKREAS